MKSDDQTWRDYLLQLCQEQDVDTMDKEAILSEFDSALEEGFEESDAFGDVCENFEIEYDDDL